MGSLESDAVNWSGLYTDSVGSPGGNLFNWKADNHAQLGWSVGEFDLNTAGDTKLANHMAQFLQNHTPANHGGKPFLAAVGFYRPHLPWDIHRQFWDMYDEDTLDIPQGYLINDLDDHVGQDTTLHHEVVSEGKWKEGIHAYLAGISYADYNAGIVLDALENSPHKDNTIIVFLGDHGWHLGEKSIWDKAHHYQRAYHTSLIIYDPGAEGNGVKCMKPVSLQDLYPTLVEVAGLEPKTDIEGESLVPLLVDPQDPNWYRPVIMTNRGHNAIRTDEYRMFVHPREAQLYRVDQDPWEFHNLYDQPGYGTVISSLNSQIAEINQVGQDLKAKLLNNYQFTPTLNILPGIVEGENYDEGVNKHSYFDKSSGNSGTEYRGDKVDIFSGSGAIGNLYLGDLEDGEWLNYTLYDVPSALYQIRFRISNINVSPGQELEVFLGTKSLGAASIPGTSSLDDWVYVTLPDVQLNTQGSRILKLLVKQGNFQLDHIKFDLSDPSDCASQPNVIISPVGPFSSDQEIQQLNAFPSGGIWSGAATSNGDFDPGQGTGLYEVIYTVVFNDTCSKADTLIIEVEEANSGGECTAPINLALGQPTQQSSTRGNGVSSIAVDGDTEGTGNNWVENPKITHTERKLSLGGR